MKKIVALALALVMVLASAALFSACGKESDVESIKEKGKLLVGVTDYAPFDYQESENSPWIGFDADMARLLGKKLGVEVEFVLIDWEKKNLELKAGTIDLIWNGMTITDDLAKEMDFSDTYAQNSQVIVIKKDNAATYTSIDSLKGKKIVAESGSSGETAAVENFTEANVTGIEGQTKAMMEVNAGTADAAVVDYALAMSLCGNGNYANLTVIDGVKIGEELFAVGARKESDLVEKINEVFAESFANGEMEKLREKYGKQDDGSNIIALCDFSKK